MYNILSDLFTTLNTQDNHIVIMAVFFGIAAITFLLRIMAHIHFRGALLAFRKDAKKPIERLDDILKLKSSLLVTSITEYKRIADKAVTNVPVEQLVNREISNMSFLGWRYSGMLPFITELERSLLFIGAILAFVFTDYAFVYGVMAVILFLLVRIIAAFFNFNGAREQLAEEILIYIEREIGRFFATDEGGAILRLKNDLTEAISGMTAGMDGVVNSMATTMVETTSAIATTMQDVSTSIERTMSEATSSIGPALAGAMDEKMINMNAKLAITLESWKEALTEAVGLQTAMNETSDRIGQSSLKLQSSAELLSKHLQGHSSALSEQLIALVSAIEAIKDGVNTLSSQQTALLTQSGYIEKNQQALDTSLASYEASLQGLTQSLGDGLGAFITLHAQSSAQTINEALKGNLEQIMLLAENGENNL